MKNNNFFLKIKMMIFQMIDNIPREYYHMNKKGESEYI